MKPEILIRNARLRNSDGNLVDIAVSKGRVAEIRRGISGPADRVIDAEGNLVTESFVNGHLHLDKVHTLEMVGMDALNAYTAGSMGGAMTAIELAAKVKERYDEEERIGSIRKALDLAVKYGNTHIRAFADTDTTAELRGIKPVIRAREEYRDRVEIQVVAFPQDGVIRDPGAEKFIRLALEAGADVVGGIPWIEYTEEDMRSHIERMFALALEFDKDVSMLVDDAGDPGLRTLEMLAVKTQKEGYQGRVTAQHARAMALYPEPYYRKIQALLSTAGIGLVSDPHTGPLHARVKDLFNAGVAVALGQDDISDAYYALGRNNMLEVAFLASHILSMTTYEDMEKLYDMITVSAAQVLGIRHFSLAVGNPAHLVVLPVDNVVDALRYHPAPSAVIMNGKVISPHE